MIKRLSRGLGAMAALAALGLGGSAIAAAAQSAPPAKPAVSQHQAQAPAGSGQSGSQTAPDRNSANESKGAGEHRGESGNEKANDGPGGHQDAPGQNVDHQFQGQE